MSQKGVEGFLGRLITDNGFRQLAQRSLSDACYGAGYDLTNEELLSIRLEDLERIEMISERLDSKIKRFTSF